MSDLTELLNQETIAITDGQMGELGVAANRLLKQQEEIRAIEEALKIAKATERRISEIEIPEMMGNLGFETITLNTGQKVSVNDSIQCAIPAPMKPKAFVWLDANGHGDLIKSVITAKFGRGDSDMADECFNALLDVGASPNQVESVHAGTLKAWARVEIAGGRTPPEDIFKIHVGKQTKIS